MMMNDVDIVWHSTYFLELEQKNCKVESQFLVLNWLGELARVTDVALTHVSFSLIF